MDSRSDSETIGWRGWAFGDELLVGIAFSLLYFPTVATSILGHDAAEFATIYADGGYAHPPGYPLYSMYLHGLSWFPVNPATGASIATALLGIAAVVLLYRAVRSWGAGRFGALFGAVAFGMSTDVWLYHTQPEVFALNHLVAAGILWLAGPNPPIRGRGRVATLGLVAGLGLSNHHTIALMFPIGLWGVYLGVRESSASVWTSLTTGACTLAAGLSPYAYLVLVETYDLGWHWGAPDSLQGVLHIFLRQDYGTFSMTANETPTGPAVQLEFLARGITEDMLVVPVLVALLGAAAPFSPWTARRQPTASESVSSKAGDTPRRRTLALIGSFVFVGPVFVTLLTRQPDGLNATMLRRFHLLPELHVAFLAGLGAGMARDYGVSSRIVRQIILGGFAIGALAVGLPARDQHHAPTVEEYIRDTLQPLPSRAVLIGGGDHILFGTAYFQKVLEYRTDILVLSPPLMSHRWYWEQKIPSSDVDYEYRGNNVGTDRLFRAIFEADRIPFVTRRFHDTLLEDWNAVPYGTTIRVYPSDESPPPPRAAFELNRRLFESFSVTLRPDAEPGTWSRSLLGGFYARTWHSLAEALRKVDANDLAKRAEAAANRFAPWSDPSDHRPETLPQRATDP